MRRAARAGVLPHLTCGARVLFVVIPTGNRAGGRQGCACVEAASTRAPMQGFHSHAPHAASYMSPPPSSASSPTTSIARRWTCSPTSASLREVSLFCCARMFASPLATFTCRCSCATCAVRLSSLSENSARTSRIAALRKHWKWRWRGVHAGARAGQSARRAGNSTSLDDGNSTRNWTGVLEWPHSTPTSSRAIKYRSLGDAPSLQSPWLLT